MEKKINKIFLAISNFLAVAMGLIQHRFGSKRNYYPCKFIGEKPNETESSNTIILYQIKGKKEIFEIPIKRLLEDTNLLEKFCQNDAIKLGAIAMGDVLFRENRDLMKKQFSLIKNKMLDDSQAAQYGFSSQENHYPCIFAGEKYNTKEPYNTIVLYAIRGKREIFQIPVKEFLEDKMLLEKIHPTDAIKLGAIAMGDSLFKG